MTSALTAIPPRTKERRSDYLDRHEVVTNSPGGDPSRMPSWGWVAAKPSEFLVVYRNGKLRESVSGQGARCFKEQRRTAANRAAELKQLQLEQESELARYKLERESERALFHMERNTELQRLEVTERLAREEMASRSEVEKARLEEEAARLRTEAEIGLVRVRFAAESEATEASLQRAFIEKALPEVARAVAGAMGNVRMHVLGSDAVSPLQLVLQSVSDVAERYAAGGWKRQHQEER